MTTMAKGLFVERGDCLRALRRPLTWFRVRCRWMVDDCSACTEMISAPALAKSGMRSSGSTIIYVTFGAVAWSLSPAGSKKRVAASIALQ